MMPRHPNWEERLAATVQAWAARDYAMGRADCGRFAAACVEAVAGVKLWPKLGAYSSEAGLAKALKRAGFADLDAACTACLGDPMPPLMAHRGDVVSDGQALGVMTGAGPLVFSHDGLVPVRRDSLTAAWAVGRADSAGPRIPGGAD